MLYAMSLSLTRCCGRLLCCLFTPVHAGCLQFECSVCGQRKAARHKHGSKCSDCHNQQHRQPSAAAAAAPAPAERSPPLSMFGRPAGCIDQLTVVERAAIVTLHKVGWTGRDIAQAIKCSENTVSLWVQRWRDDHSVADAERSGRPRCTAEETDEKIEEMAEEKKFVVPKDIRRCLQLECCARTVRRRLDEVNLFGRVAREKDDYDERILKLRLSFARGFLHFTDQEWDAMIFSDEVHFCLGHHGQVWVQRPPGAAYDPQYCKPPDEARYTVTLWGCFCSKGIGAGRIFEGELNKQLYRDILEHNLKPTYQRFYPHQLFRFLQDNASPHYNPEVNTWMHNHGVHVMEFPPRSPDLNPIENLWHTLKWRIERRNPCTAEDLERILKEEYEAISTEECRILARSMHSRLEQVIAYEGHKTQY
jgi:transposase